MHKPNFMRRNEWEKKLGKLKVNQFFVVGPEAQALPLRQFLSRGGKRTFPDKKFTVIKKKTHLKIGAIIKKPVFQCWRIK